MSNPTVAQSGLAGAGRWVLVATILASSMAFIDGSALNVALPAVQADLSGSGAQLLWVINGYQLVLAALILPGGALGDRLGRKKVLMAGIGLFTLASAACGVAPSIGFLIGARVVQGIGGALMIPGSLAIISSFFGASRGQAIGTWAAATTLVTVAGPLLGGTLASLGLWRGVFVINLPLGVVALAVLARQVPESSDDEAGGGLDVLGALLAMVGLAALTFGLLSAPDLGFGDPRVFGSLLVAVVALAAFLVVEARGKAAMLPLEFFRARPFSGANLLTLFLYGALSVSLFFLSLNLVQAQGYSPAVAGFSFLPFTLLLTVLSRWAGRLADRRGARLLLIAGPAVVGLSFALLGLVGLTSGPAQYWTTFFPGYVALGVGMGLTVAPLSTTVMSSVDADRAGVASGVNNAVSRTAGVLAVALVGALALAVFAQALETRTAGLPLPAEARAALRAEANRLGQAAVPAELPPQDATAVRLAIRLSLVTAYRVVMFVSAGLAWISALMAALLIDRPRAPAGGP